MMNVLNVLAAMPSTNISPAFLLVISQLPLTHLQLASAVQATGPCLARVPGGEDAGEGLDAHD
jgi:hypothetical protein